MLAKRRFSALIAATIALTTLSSGLAMAAPPDPDQGGSLGEGSTEGGPTAEPTATTLRVEAEVPTNCTLSPYHSLFDEEAAIGDNVLQPSWSASTAGPVDPNNSNYNLRSATLGLTNPTQHTFYQSVYLLGWIFVSRTNSSSGPWNYAAWDAANERFQTGFDPNYPDSWSGSWYPRDSSVPGAVVTFVDSTYQVGIYDPTELGYDNFGANTTRPGYLITDDIAPGASLSWIQIGRVERPENNGYYAYQSYRYLATRTCLPVPTITDIPAVGPTVLSGTGTTVGDTIEVTDSEGNVIGTAVVDDSLNWTLSLDSPLAESITELKVTETDEFGFTGSATTLIPVATPTPTPSPSSTTDPSSTASPSSSPSSTAKGSSDEDLAFTGVGNVWPLLGAGLLAVIAGGVLLVVRRRRQSS